MTQILQSNSKIARLLLALVVLVAVLFPALALADMKPEVATPASSTFDPLTPALMRQALEGPGVMGSTPLTDPSAAEQLPRNDIGRVEALELAESVFGSAVEAPAGVWDELSEARILGTHTAALPSEDPQMVGAEAEEAEPNAVLLESSLPLLSEVGTGEEEPVDLSLESTEGTFQPANPLVPTKVPAELDEGVSLANGSMHLGFSGIAPDRAPTVINEDLAFYPNTAQDTDLMIAPMPGGVETLTQLRTAEAPRNQAVHLNLPEGAVLEETNQGGAEAQLNGRTLLRIPPPTALDAAGALVPMTLSVSGNQIELEVSPPTGATYPILADPEYLVETYNWTWGTSSFAGWQPSQTAGGYRALEYAYPNQSVKALGLSSGWEGGAAPNTGAQWYFKVPRYNSDNTEYGESPSTWLERVHLEGVEYLLEGSSGSEPVMVAGILDPYQNLWIAVGSHTGSEGEITGWSGNYTFPQNEPNLNQHGKIFSFGLITRETESYVKYRTALAAIATVTIHDSDTPEVLSVNGPEGWWNTGEPTISYSAKDKGLGIYSLRVTPPGQSTIGYAVGCSGGGTSPCPRIEDSAKSPSVKVPLKIASAPEGPDMFTLGAVDPVSHVGTAPFRVNVDHSAPSLSLTGSATEQGVLGTAKPQYSLKYSASDGTEEAPTLAVMGASGIFSHPADIAVDAVGNRWIADETNNRIVKCDSTGAVVASYSAVGSTESLSHPTGIDVDSSGNVWVVDSGHNRVVEFTSGGEWIRKIGKLGSGNSEFSHPTGIAVGANGNVWVADTGNNRVQEFSSTGSFIGAFGGKGSANGQLLEPSGVDVGPGNKVWVADTGNNRIEELDEKGEFLAAYGSLGPGNGQLNHPTGIDVDTRGSVWVVDQGNGRVEQFSERGEYLGKFGSPGAGEAQFNFTAPAGITTNAIGVIWVADSGNNRISRWNAPQGTRSGLRKVVVKLDGKVVQEPSITCPEGGCPLVGEWTLHSGEYGAGAHTVEVTATDGVGLTKTEKVAITLNPPAPTVTLSGTLTQQSSLGTTLPRYSLKMEAAAEEGTGAAPTIPTFVSAIAPTSEAAKLSHPGGIAIDSKGNLWVVDKAHNRLVEYNEAGEFIREAGGLGTAGGKLSSPTGITIDSVGNLDVTDTGNNRVAQFNSTGAFIEVIGSNVNKTKVEAGGTTLEKNRCTAASGNVCQAGVAGSGEGQIAEPIGITTTGGQNVFIVERANNRIEKFSPQAEVLAKFGELGSGNGQLKEPTGIAFHGFLLWVADTGNNRMEAFTTSYAYSRNFGKEGSGNGEFHSPSAVSADALGNVWVVDQANNRIQEFSEAGEYLGKFGKAGTGAGQFTLSAPTGIATGSSGAVWVSDTNNNRIERWRQGARSQLTTEITIDGNRVDGGEARCLIETCPVSRELTLESSTVAPGAHTLVAKATDGLGQWTTKTRTIEIHPDTTKPVLQVGGELANAPEGWVQQESYGFNASATDERGYGVTSLIFRIDGIAVLSKTQACGEGGCSASISGGINMTPYSGGAHEAEVVATDGAGNSSTRRWTINVDPEGHISTQEATDTLEAVEATAAALPLGGAESVGVDGDPPLALETTGTGFAATGGSVPTELSTSPGGSMTVEIPTGRTLYGCPSEQGQTEGACSPGTTSEDALLPVQITPVGTSEAASPSILVEENAAISAITQTSADTTIRPLDDGGMVYAAIRDPSAPERYSYMVTVGGEQELRQIDEKHIEAFYNTGQPSFLISAEPATDAVGTEVPTSLELTGANVVTLTVHHRAGLAGAAFVYPVVAGSGWEGGFHTTTVEMDNLSPEEQLEPGEEAGEVGELFVSAPEPVSEREAEEAEEADPENPGPVLSRPQSRPKSHFFRGISCETRFVVIDPTQPKPRENPECGNPFTREEGSERAVYSYGIRGHVFVNPGSYVAHRATPFNDIECAKMTYGDHFGGLLESSFFIDEPTYCQWWPRHGDDGGKLAVPIHHITAYGEWKTGRGSPGEWTVQMKGLGLFIWALPDGYKVKKRKTTCPEC